MNRDLFNINVTPDNFERHIRILKNHYNVITFNDLKRNDIKEAVNKIVLSEYPGLKLSVSIGGVCGVHPITEAIRQADILMYEDKEKTYAEASTPPEL